MYFLIILNLLKNITHCALKQYLDLLRRLLPQPSRLLNLSRQFINACYDAALLFEEWEGDFTCQKPNFLQPHAVRSTFTRSLTKLHKSRCFTHPIKELW